MGVGIGELLATVVAPLAALGILYSRPTAPPEMDEAHPGGKGFDVPPPTPPLPGLTPPVTGAPRPGEGGFTAPPPTPSVLPGQDGRRRNRGRPSFRKTATTGFRTG